jgi:putative SOS response-associated peptidase YedK
MHGSFIARLNAMCVNYRPPLPEQLDMVLGVLVDLYRDWDWSQETWKDYEAPIVRAAPGGGRELRLASYGMVPRRHIPPGVKVFDTMNARAESIAEKRSFARAWHRAQLCTVPMTCFYEPNYESGRAERFGIGMQDDAPFHVAGLWREWREADGKIATSFTQITINADEHPLMRRFHKPDDEKRALVVLAPNEVDAWLQCRSPELARSFLRPYPAEAMKAWPAPNTQRKPAVAAAPAAQGSLF